MRQAEPRAVLKEKYTEVVPPFGGATSRYFGKGLPLVERFLPKRSKHVQK
jgi:hypothetical protein